ncbi:hypothetical protein SAMN02799630_05011 [Paenibacillus sp. UNCCL117]|uniref:DUF6063 family protein n=1 Tax=unclassified Paenibacillus TaxID=185978 RepID=UPI00088B76A6|nr:MULTISPECIES: DUF6063 family protein [unclassified Paenibacillus]SDE25746.1 hypothetical protein SAMN04488602_12324 [Paenibacillus sp. cl123]SFW62481.1 hypothetical protein SAMN02799630_05011 [Paenibacillus sp. UNCCL117]
MQVEEAEVMKAFRIYALLSREGSAGKEAMQEYEADDRVRGLVDQFAAEVECVTLSAGDRLYMIPLARLSPFHMSNDALKKTYLRGGAVNADLYLMYAAVIVLIGAFYDSYQTIEPTRNFLDMEEWLELVRVRMDALREHSAEELRELSQEYSYHWAAVVEKWDALDDVKETAKRQSGQTLSRLSFLDTVKRFLIDQELAAQVGPQELELTEKAKIIVQRYFMELEYNRGILDFLYRMNKEKSQQQEEAGADAGHS